MLCYTKDSLSIGHQMRYQNYRFGYKPGEDFYSVTPKVREALQIQCYQYHGEVIL